MQETSKNTENSLPVLDINKSKELNITEQFEMHKTSKTQHNLILMDLHIYKATYFANITLHHPSHHSHNTQITQNWSP